MRTYLEKCLMNIPRSLIHTRPWTTHSSRNIVELELGEQAEIPPDMEIEMRHHAAHYVTVMILRPGAEHPVVVVFVLRAISSPREIYLCGPRPGECISSDRRNRDAVPDERGSSNLVRRETGSAEGDAGSLT